MQEDIVRNFIRTHHLSKKWEEYLAENGIGLFKNDSEDVINPDHYKQGEVECIVALEAATVNKKGIEAVCTANVIKYLLRYEAKNGLEDVKKARWYLDKLIEKLEETAV